MPIARKYTGKKTRIKLKPSKALTSKMRDSSDFSGYESRLSFKRAIIKKGNRSRSKLMVVKRYRYPIQPVQNQFKTLNSLRQIPKLRKFIPPTVRIIRRRHKKPELLLTDFSEGGKYLVLNVEPVVGRKFMNIKNWREIVSETSKLNSLMLENGFESAGDAIVVQVDPTTMTGFRIWIADAGTITRKGNLRSLLARLIGKKGRKE